MKILNIVIFISLSILAYAEEYSFDFEEFEKKPYEFLAKYSFQPDFSLLDKNNRLYKLAFWQKEEKDFFKSMNQSLQLNGSYLYKDFKFYSDLLGFVNYTKDEEWDHDYQINELFINYDYNTSLLFQVGKKSLKWGKGYVSNPVSLLGREKDINDLEASLEGYWILKSDYVKSFSGLIQNIAISPIYLFSNKNINDDLSNSDLHTIALKNYFLINNIDLDLYLLYTSDDNYKISADFAYNILENWEIHGEYAFLPDQSKNILQSNYQTDNIIKSSNNYLIGTRILFPWESTVILEYFHNENGYSKNELELYFKALDNSLVNNSEISIVKKFQSENFTSQYLMKDYLYFKFSHPEPFDLLYFTPSIFSLLNLNDSSFLLGGEFSYSKIENLALKLRYNFMLGTDYSEFGEKINKSKISFLAEYSF